MTVSEYAHTLREAAEVMSILADAIEEQMGDDDIDAVMANAAMALQAVLSGTPLG